MFVRKTEWNRFLKNLKDLSFTTAVSRILYSRVACEKHISGSVNHTNHKMSMANYFQRHFKVSKNQNE